MRAMWPWASCFLLYLFIIFCTLLQPQPRYEFQKNEKRQNSRKEQEKIEKLLYSIYFFFLTVFTC